MFLSDLKKMKNNPGGAGGSDLRAEMLSQIPPWVFITVHVVDRVFTTIWLLIKSGFWLGVAYIAYLAIKELAGQTTVANFVLGYFTSETPGGTSSIIWMFVAGACFVWAKIERWLRLRKVSSMSNRIKHLEILQDRNRSSSGLTNSGETPQEEQLP